MARRAQDSKDETELVEEVSGKDGQEPGTPEKAAKGHDQESSTPAEDGGVGTGRAAEADGNVGGEAGVEGDVEADGEVGAEALQQRVAEAEQALEAAVREKDELYDRWLRLQAEFDNFRRRTRKEMEESRTRGAEDLVVKLLPVIDNLERAIASADTGPSGGLAEGVRMIHKQFLTVLEGVGVTPIQAVGNPFDPNLHEAVAYEESDEHPEGTVMEDMLRGYALGEKVLRPSMVKVARGSGNKEETKSDE